MLHMPVYSSAAAFIHVTLITPCLRLERHFTLNILVVNPEEHGHQKAFDIIRVMERGTGNRNRHSWRISTHTSIEFRTIG